MTKFYSYILFLIASFTISSDLVAQIIVNETGHVSMGDTIPINLAQTVVYNCQAGETGLRAISNVNNEWGFGIDGFARDRSNRQVGIRGLATKTISTNNGRSYGVYGEAGNRTSGYNFGIYGNLSGQNNGAGIFGTCGESYPLITGRYAGYFNGNVHVTQNLTTNTMYTLSDTRYLMNVGTIESSSLNDIRRLNPIQYQWDSQSIYDLHCQDQRDTARSQELQEIVPISSVVHYGLLSEEVMQIFPDLVQNDKEGIISINYIEIIPLLINAIKELDYELQELKGFKELIDSHADTRSLSLYENTYNLEHNNLDPIQLSNPVKFRYKLPISVKSANIVIYNKTGKQVDYIELIDRGDVEYSYSTHHLNDDFYFCVLYIDGAIVETMKMIVLE